MKKSLMMGFVCIAVGAFAAADAPAQVKLGKSTTVEAPADVTVSKINLDKATPTIDKTGGTTKPMTVDFLVSKDTKIATKKFVLGAMDADESSAPMIKIPKDKCARYVMNIDVFKKNGKSWDKVMVSRAHGDWYSSTAPGQVDRCKLKDGGNVAPTVWTKPITLPADNASRSDGDVYRVVVEAGFTAGSWPKNVTESITERRKVKSSITMVN